MNNYSVTVKNLLSGEFRVIEVRADSGEDAQVNSLRVLFRESGWRKAVALRPVGGLLTDRAA